MEREDMLERAVRQVAAALARILGKSATTTPAECLEEIDAVCRQFTGIPAELFDRLPAAEVVALLEVEIRKGRMTRPDAGAIILALADLRRKAGQDVRAAALVQLAGSLGQEPPPLAQTR